MWGDDYISESGFSHIISKTSHVLIPFQVKHKYKGFIPGIFQSNIAFMHSTVIQHQRHCLCFWLWRKQSSVRFLWLGPTSPFSVTPVTSDDPLRRWNNAAGTVNVTVNVGYCAAAPTPSSYPLCLTLLSLRGSPHITATLGRIIFYSHFFCIIFEQAGELGLSTSQYAVSLHLNDIQLHWNMRLQS